MSLLGAPEYMYAWYRSSYRVCTTKWKIKMIEQKYEWLFCHLDLDYNGYLALRELKDKEIAAIKKATQ
jgi:hypothetical protein